MAGLDFPLSNASPVSSRKLAHDSGPNWYAFPSFVRLFHPLLPSGFNRRFPIPHPPSAIFYPLSPTASPRKDPPLQHPARRSRLFLLTLWCAVWLAGIAARADAADG